MKDPNVFKAYEGKFHFRGPVITRVDNRETIDHVETFNPCFVENVRKMWSGMFHFNFVGDGVEYQSSYPWAFVVASDENFTNYLHWRELQIAADQHAKIAREALDQLITLEEVKNSETNQRNDRKPDSQ